jgi:hypothetical protein
MSEKKKPKVTIKVYEAWPSDPKKAGLFQMTLEQAKKYASSKPLRRPPPRNPS